MQVKLVGVQPVNFINNNGETSVIDYVEKIMKKNLL